jgi:hypothetical protein
VFTPFSLITKPCDERSVPEHSQLKYASTLELFAA